MATRHRTILRQEVAFAAGDTPIIDDLPVNPLSFVDVTLRGAAAAANTLPSHANMLAVLTNIEVLFKGSSIIAIDPDDLFVLQHYLEWLRAVAQPHSDVGLDVWRLTLRVSFSRKPYWINEGFPASRRGELQLRLSVAAAFTNVGGLSLNIETEEILDAQFRQFLKYTTLSRTPTATGESDQDLPIGNPLAGVLLFGTTVPTATGVAASMREVRFMMDNQEVIIPRTRWDTLHAQLQQRMSPYLWASDHAHRAGAGIPAANELFEAAQYDAVSPVRNYAYLDFDPLQDGSYFVQTAGRSSVRLRINADLATAQRIIPIEIIELAAAAAP